MHRLNTIKHYHEEAYFLLSEGIKFLFNRMVEDCRCGTKKRKRTTRAAEPEILVLLPETPKKAANRNTVEPPKLLMQPGPKPLGNREVYLISHNSLSVCVPKEILIKIFSEGMTVCALHDANRDESLEKIMKQKYRFDENTPLFGIKDPTLMLYYSIMSLKFNFEIAAMPNLLWMLLQSPNQVYLNSFLESDPQIISKNLIFKTLKVVQELPDFFEKTPEIQRKILTDKIRLSNRGDCDSFLHKLAFTLFAKFPDRLPKGYEKKIQSLFREAESSDDLIQDIKGAMIKKFEDYDCQNLVKIHDVAENEGKLLALIIRPVCIPNISENLRNEGFTVLGEEDFWKKLQEIRLQKIDRLLELEGQELINSLSLMIKDNYTRTDPSFFTLFENALNLYASIKNSAELDKVYEDDKRSALLNSLGGKKDYLEEFWKSNELKDNTLFQLISDPDSAGPDFVEKLECNSVWCQFIKHLILYLIQIPELKKISQYQKHEILNFTINSLTKLRIIENEDEAFKILTHFKYHLN